MGDEKRTVYVVLEEYSYESSGILGVFSDKVVAQAFARGNRHPGRYSPDIVIQSWVLDDTETNGDEVTY